MDLLPKIKDGKLIETEPIVKIEKAPRRWKKKLTPRKKGTNPRSKGTNPRKKGTNPRARREREIARNQRKARGEMFRDFERLIGKY